jgi:hypothetical protein
MGMGVCVYLSAVHILYLNLHSGQNLIPEFRLKATAIFSLYQFSVIIIITLQEAQAKLYQFYAVWPVVQKICITQKVLSASINFRMKHLYMAYI